MLSRGYFSDSARKKVFALALFVSFFVFVLWFMFLMPISHDRVRTGDTEDVDAIVEGVNNAANDFQELEADLARVAEEAQEAESQLPSDEEIAREIELPRLPVEGSSLDQQEEEVNE